MYEKSRNDELLKYKKSLSLGVMLMTDDINTKMMMMMVVFRAQERDSLNSPNKNHSSMINKGN